MLFRSIKSSMLEVVKQEELSDEFFLFNDDFKHRRLDLQPLVCAKLIVPKQPVRLQSFRLPSDEPDEAMREVLLNASEAISQDSLKD